MKIGDRVKVIGPARVEIHINERYDRHNHVLYGSWGEVTDAQPDYVRVRLDGHSMAELWYPRENILDFFTATCEDVISENAER